MANKLTAAPVLSTPADDFFQHVEPEASDKSRPQPRTSDELFEIYEVTRTANELRAGGWRRIALQFPDTMLCDAPWVVEALKNELSTPAPINSNPDDAIKGDIAPITPDLGTAGETRTQATDEATPSNDASNKGCCGKALCGQGIAAVRDDRPPIRIYIMADTSYSACCVDEVAAEHINADVVVHYGRSCLSPTSRLPVVYVFTRHQLQHEDVAKAFEQEFSEKEAKVVLVADVTYQDHVPALTKTLRAAGYTKLLSTSIVHDPKGRIPNRRLLGPNEEEVPLNGSEEELKDYSVFHIATPPTALLLALSSRVKSLHIYSTSTSDSSTPTSSQFTRRVLGRRYARLLSLSTAGVIGILVNTLSVSNFLASIDLIRKQIASAGKKSYTVVVGKLNPAKLANFAEIDGWVVVGCWESSLVEDDAGFFQPVITPFELDAALTSDDTRVWGADWWGGIETVKAPEASEDPVPSENTADPSGQPGTDMPSDTFDGGDIDEEESEPPEFDLRTGKLVSHSRPMKVVSGNSAKEAATPGSDGLSSALALRSKAEIATVNGVASPGAEYLRSQRTWQGLGTDFDIEEKSTAIEEGRGGVARGYVVGDSIRS